MTIMENSMKVPQKTKNRTIIWFSNSTPGYISIKNENIILIQKDTCTPMFKAASFTIAQLWKQPKCPSTDKWIKKKLCYKGYQRLQICQVLGLAHISCFNHVVSFCFVFVVFLFFYIYLFLIQQVLTSYLFYTYTWLFFIVVLSALCIGITD